MEERMGAWKNVKGREDRKDIKKKTSKKEEKEGRKFTGIEEKEGEHDKDGRLEGRRKK